MFSGVFSSSGVSGVSEGGGAVIKRGDPGSDWHDEDLDRSATTFSSTSIDRIRTWDFSFAMTLVLQVSSA